MILISTFLFSQNILAKEPKKSPKENTDQELSLDQIQSIMLNSEELSKIDQAFSLFGQGKEFTIEEVTEEMSDEDRAKLAKEKLSEEMRLIQEKSKIYLASILYFSDKIWSIWLNDKRITSMTNKSDEEFFVKKIDGKSIDLIWSLGLSKWKILMGEGATPPKVNELNQIQIKITLYPNQTFLLRENRIVEGGVIAKSPKSSNQNIATKDKINK